MARIAGVEIPTDKQVHVALTYVYGIGQKSSMYILNKCSIKPETRVRDLTEGEIGKISGVISEEFAVEGDLQRRVTGNVKRLRDIKSYRGERHAKSLPSRGQRTRTNARTRRGRKMAVAGTSHKKIVSKT